MLIVKKPIKFRDGTLEPGTRAPVDLIERLKPHVLLAMKNQNELVECTEDEAIRIREQYLNDQKRGAEQFARKHKQRVEAQIEQARREAKAKAREAQEAKEAHAAFVERCEDLEAEAKANLDALESELASLHLNGVDALPTVQPPAPVSESESPEARGSDSEAEQKETAPPKPKGKNKPKGQKKGGLTKTKVKRMKMADLTKLADEVGIAYTSDVTRGALASAVIAAKNL